MSAEEAHQAEYLWKGGWARDKQVAPDGDWAIWVVRAGRGFGKSRTGSMWVHDRALAQPNRRIAMVARTPADARDFMIEGPGGILRNTHPGERPHYEPSKRRVTWNNGSWATIYSDEEPDQLRGFSGDTAWLDEFAKFKNPVDTWDNLQFGMREVSNDQPRRLITTTPRPIPILSLIEKDPKCVVVTGSSYENRDNLDDRWFADTISRYEGTRLGRQEISAEILADVPGALWTRSMLDAARHLPIVKSSDLVEWVKANIKRVVIGVDPSGTSGEDQDRGNSVGIVAVGLGNDGIGYVLADWTCSLSPHGWGRRVIDLAEHFDVDRIVVERNFGGAMCEATIRTAKANAPIKMVTASRGKVARAEPVSALYEQNKIKHVAAVPELEDQMCAFTSDGYIGGGSPDRVDALVWAITELMLMRQRFEEMSEVGLPL